MLDETKYGKEEGINEAKLGQRRQIFLFSLLEQFGKIRISSYDFISTLRVHCFFPVFGASLSPPVSRQEIMLPFVPPGQSGQKGRNSSRLTVALSNCSHFKLMRLGWRID